MFLSTVDPADAVGEVARIYREELSQRGFVMQATRCFTARSDLLPLYEHFSNGIRANFSLGPRGWKLITLIAAKETHSSYCSHVYAQSLIADFGSKTEVLAIQRDFRNAGLDRRDVAMLAYAETIARDASKVTAADIDALRAAGFTDREICDIALCASFRAFVSRFFDAMGTEPEPDFIDADEAFCAAMTVGKPV